MLQKLRYVDANNAVKLKGRVACEINNHELIITELVFENAFTDLHPTEIVALLSCFVFQQVIYKYTRFHSCCSHFNELKRDRFTISSFAALRNISPSTSLARNPSKPFPIFQLLSSSPQMRTRCTSHVQTFSAFRKPLPSLKLLIHAYAVFWLTNNKNVVVQSPTVRNSRKEQLTRFQKHVRYVHKFSSAN